MNFRNLFFISALIAPLSALAQTPFPISLGVKGGTSLTDAFSNRTTVGVDTASHTYSQKKDYIVGPMLEVHLPMGVSVEGDALYRPLNLTWDYTVVPLGSTREVHTVNTWEFPILVKYHLPFPIVKPFIEAVPSFRHVSEFGGDTPHLSTKGFATGVGVEAKALFVRVAPEFRYTHWGNDSNPSTSFFNPKSNSNQLEFLVGISF